VYALAALVITVGVLWAFIEYGIPELSRRAALAMPASINKKLGAEGLQIMDRILFEPSELNEETKAKFTGALARLSSRIEAAPELRVIFRKSDSIGANAFALPDGTIIFTDELIELSEDDKEIIAIMAHEAGHVIGRHSLRMILQNSTVALIISTATGDLTSVSALASAIPTILVEAKYSQEIETEADTYALEYMRKAGIETVHFANILVRMGKKKGQTKGRNYLSSHPATMDRVKRFRK
ncbi:MAG: M48 family metallopeptidase, partial [Thermodesulfobacteriota bacterium]